MPGYAQNSQVAPAPLLRGAELQNGYKNDAYNQQMGVYNSKMDAWNEAAKSGMMAFATSDRRLKSNINRIGTHPLGIGIYEYDIFGKHDVGVMAQELLDVKPDAVFEDNDGFYMVDYGMIGGKPKREDYSYAR